MSTSDNAATPRHRWPWQHKWRTSDEPVGFHVCEGMSYCHHNIEVCECGKSRVGGYAVEEVR